MAAVKIVIIGAGSASFGPSTLASLMNSSRLRGATIALVDTDTQALENMRRLAVRLNEQWRAGMTVMATTERSAVLPDADFVVVSVEVPPREPLWRIDWEITNRHGLRQPYGENGGPGGLMHALRQIPPVIDIARDMEACSPNAWLINFSNPLPRITRAVSKYTPIKIVGKCHQLRVGYGIAAALLADYFEYALPPKLDFHSSEANSTQIDQMADLGRQHLKIKAAGLNHFTWMVDVRDRQTGEDLYPALRRALTRLPPDFEPLSMELFRIFDYCPVPGDTHLCEFLPWTHDPITRPWERYNLLLYDWDANEAARASSHRAVVEMGNGSQTVDELARAQSEGAVELIEAIAGNLNLYDEAVNIPNQGAIPNLPAEAVVELPALISGSGISGTNVGPLPPPIAELCRREAALVEMIVDAAVTGDRELALQALLLDPMMNDIGRAEAILDDYLEAFAAYLPQFAT